MTPEWISAIVAVISLPISIWAIVASRKNSKSIKQVASKIGIEMKGNTIVGGGTMIHFGDKKDTK